jgi:hypothetical protein
VELRIGGQAWTQNEVDQPVLCGAVAIDGHDQVEIAIGDAALA